MTQKEISDFLFNDKAVEKEKSETPEPVNEYIRYLERQNFALWDVAYENGYGKEGFSNLPWGFCKIIWGVPTITSSSPR